MSVEVSKQHHVDCGLIVIEQCERVEKKQQPRNLISAEISNEKLLLRWLMVGLKE